MDRLLAQTKEKMKVSVAHAERQLARIRAGRATPAILDDIQVDVYGAQLPVNQVATISVPEPRLLMISPWDKSTLKAIERAIMTSDLGLNPSNDGTVIRIQIPALTEEGRKEMARRADAVAEEGRVAVRALRRECIEAIKKMEKEEGLSEDEVRAGEKEAQELHDKQIDRIDELLERKKEEVMEL